VASTSPCSMHANTHMIDCHCAGIVNHTSKSKSKVVKLSGGGGGLGTSNIAHNSTPSTSSGSYVHRTCLPASITQEEVYCLLHIVRTWHHFYVEDCVHDVRPQLHKGPKGTVSVWRLPARWLCFGKNVSYHRVRVSLLSRDRFLAPERVPYLQY